MLNSSDEELMAQVRQGDLRKLAVLFERHHRRLFQYFLTLTGDRQQSEDLVQEVFFRILRYRQSYDQTKPYVAWMYQIARNSSREASRKTRYEPIDQADPVSPALGADEIFRKRQEVGLLGEALGRLPEEKREVLVLSRFQNMKYEEIAQVLGCEVGAVKVRVFRALRALGQIYMELSGEKAS